MHGSNAEVIPQTRRGFLRRYAGLMKWSSVVLIVISLALFARTLPLEQLVEGLQTWIEGLGVWGPVVFVLLYVLATVLLVPAWPFTVAAGAMFGLWKGTVAASVAATTTAAVAFLIARYLARERVARQVEQYPKFAAIDRAIGEGGWRIVALLRLSPAVPFNLQNYLYGLTSIRFWPCVLTSWLAMLPGTFMYVYLGYLGGAGLQAASGSGTSAGIGQWVLRVVGLLATIAVTVYITLLARKALREKTAIEPSSGGGQSGGSSRRDEPLRPDESQAKQGQSWGPLFTLMLAIVLAATAAWTYGNRDLVRSFVESRLVLKSKENGR